MWSVSPGPSQHRVEAFLLSLLLCRASTNCLHKPSERPVPRISTVACLLSFVYFRPSAGIVQPTERPHLRILRSQ